VDYDLAQIVDTVNSAVVVAAEIDDLVGVCVYSCGYEERRSCEGIFIGVSSRRTQVMILYRGPMTETVLSLVLHGNTVQTHNLQD
jgi:hypothetical protein